MNRTRAVILSLAVGAAAVAGVFALGHTLALGQQAQGATDRQVARRAAQLDRYQASLQRALKARPPGLPPLPATSTAASPQSAVPARIVYHRPPPVVVTVHRSDKGDHEEGGSDD